MKQVLMLTLCLTVVGVVTSAETQKDELISLLQRVLAERSPQPSCDNYKQGAGNQKRALLQYTSCSADSDCSNTELCCKGIFVDVCIAKSELMGDNKAEEKPAVVDPPSTTATPKPENKAPIIPPPKGNDILQDDNGNGLCTTLPKNDFTKRTLETLIDLMEGKRVYNTELCGSGINTHDICKEDEICCPSPLGNACFKIKDTARGR